MDLTSLTPAAATGKILVIDDEDMLRHTLTRVLRRLNYEVATAADGPDALRLLAESSYDLIYLDIRLPGMDGLQILKEIRQRDAKLPVILLTAYGSLQTALEALRLGATDYLLKPVDPEVLLARTRVILDEQTIERRRRELREQIAALQEELRQLEVGRVPEALIPTVPPPPEERFLKRGALILDLQARRATWHEQVVFLPPAAFDYLVVLARHAPEVISYQTLVAEAQGYHADPNEARDLAKWHVHALRQTLETDPADPHYLINVRGIGYRLLVN
jgi:DNA-binding response OmpR family regulator